MREDCLKLTSYLGERDRAGHAFLADALTAVYARHGLQVSLLARGVVGFGRRHQLHTDRLLSLSEDLPLVSVAVDSRARVEACLPEVLQLGAAGLITVERARMISGSPIEAPWLPWSDDACTKLTVYVGRGERAAGRLAYEELGARLAERGLDGACALLGVDGTVGGARRRASFFSANSGVPVMLIAIGATGKVCALVAELGRLLERPLLTLERVQLCKRDGVLLEPPQEHLPRDPAEQPIWQKLMVLSGEQDQVGGEPLHQRLVRELRRRGAAGATVLRGVWGFRAPQPPHGDSLWQLRRRSPMLTVIVDSPERIRRWFSTVDELTRRHGTVTCELVPAFRARP